MACTRHVPEPNGFHDLHNGHVDIQNGHVEDIQNGHTVIFIYLFAFMGMVDFQQWLGHVDPRRIVHCGPCKGGGPKTGRKKAT
jgi:hypothetical protein